MEHQHHEKRGEHERKGDEHHKKGDEHHKKGDEHHKKGDEHDKKGDEHHKKGDEQHKTPSKPPKPIIYSFLKAKVSKELPIYVTESAHQTMFVTAAGVEYQINFDIASTSAGCDVKVIVVPKVDAKILLQNLDKLPAGMNVLEKADQSSRLDYVRQKVVDVAQFPSMLPMPKEELRVVLKETLSIGTPLYILGCSYNNAEVDTHDETIYGVNMYRQHVGAFPPLGMHNMHMMQGSNPPRALAEGSYRDGAIFAVQPDGSVTGVFLVFDHQSFYTNDKGYDLKLPVDDPFFVAIYNQLKTPAEKILYAAEHKLVPQLAQLLAAGTPTNVTTLLGITPLHLAARSGSVDNVKALLKKGADPKAVSALKTSVLHSAVLGASPDIVKLLLDAGAPVDVRDVQAKLPVDMAEATDKDAVIALFIPNRQTAPKK